MHFRFEHLMEEDRKKMKSKSNLDSNARLWLRFPPPCFFGPVFSELVQAASVEAKLADTIIVAGTAGMPEEPH